MTAEQPTCRKNDYENTQVSDPTMKFIICDWSVYGLHIINRGFTYGTVFKCNALHDGEKVGRALPVQRFFSAAAEQLGKVYFVLRPITR